MPFTEGQTVSGWGVYRSAPWHFAGIFDTQEKAQAEADRLGAGYVVKYGDNQVGTDNFIATDETPNA